ncbi:MAG: prenyltransferase/squalene oxidase repeat-containing protein [Candidatus Thermoplasmatota archaeon]
MMEHKNIEIDKSIEKGINYLVKNQNQDGSICLNNDRTWDVWETANALLAIDKEDVGSNFIEKSLQFLTKSKRKDKSFYVSSTYNDNQYCMETTPTVVSTFKKYGIKLNETIEFIKKKQKKKGYWEIGIPEITKYKDWPSITGFALNSLSDSKFNSEKTKMAIEWLKNKQKADGSWGHHFIYYDTPFYPMHIVLKVLKENNLQDTPVFIRAIKFVINKQKKEGFWDIGTKYEKKPSVELRTSLALLSLLKSDNEQHIVNLKKGVRWLIKKQKISGSWDGGYFVGWPGKKEDIYSTSLSISALKEYKAKEIT